MQATSQPSTVANAKSTICCKVDRTVGAENSERAIPANELASSPYGSSTAFTNNSPLAPGRGPRLLVDLVEPSRRRHPLGWRADLRARPFGQWCVAKTQS